MVRAAADRCASATGDTFIEPPLLFPNFTREIRLISPRKARRGRYATGRNGVNERKSSRRRSHNMKIFSNPRFLVIYSAVVTAAFAVTLLCGFAASRNQSFDVLTVHRINFVEPDGTPRLIISNRESFPGAYMRGKEYPRPDRREAAGMIFINDEGSEMGGLIFGGLKMKDGTIQNHGHLSFDQYEQDQIFAVDSGREDQDKFSAIRIGERGDYPIQQAWMPTCRSANCPRTSRLRNGRNSSRLIPVMRTESIWAGRPTNPRLCGSKTITVTIAWSSALMLREIR